MVSAISIYSLQLLSTRHGNTTLKESTSCGIENKEVSHATWTGVIKCILCQERRKSRPDSKYLKHVGERRVMEDTAFKTSG